MHCLPAHRGEEVAASVVDGPQSRVFPQAHNRLHAFRGLLRFLLEDERMSTKTQRQHRIAKLLAEQAVTSQAHLVDLLAAEGVQATQATVSRDLEDLGAIKVRGAGGETVYAIPELPDRAAGARGPPPPRVRRLGGGGGPLGQPRRAAHARPAPPTWWARPSTAPASRGARHRGRR